jgi:hypothetical protein
MTAAIEPSSEQPDQLNLAGLVPSKRKIRDAVRLRRVAWFVWGIPLLLLSIAMYWRLAVGTLVLHLGPFAWILPLFVVTVIAALLFALVVEPASGGNQLGDELRAARQIDNAAMAMNDELAAAEVSEKQQGDICIEAGEGHLVQANDVMTEALERSHRGLQLASAVLEVGDVPGVRRENVMKPTLPQLNRVQARLATENATHVELAKALGIEYLPAHIELPSSHAPTMTPPEVAVDPDHYAGTMPNFPASTLGSMVLEDQVEDDRGRSENHRWRGVAMLVALVMLVAVAIWYITRHGAAGAFGATPTSISMPTTTPSNGGSGTGLVPAHPIAPTGLRNGVDYNFLEYDRSGALARWSCTALITVHLAGPAPKEPDGPVQTPVVVRCDCAA